MSVSPGFGLLQVALTDKPSDPVVTAVNVCLERVDVVFTDDRPIVRLDVNLTVDLFDLRNGVSASLGIAQLPVGTIEQLRLILCPDGASAVIDGVVEPLKVPSGEQTGIKLTRPGGFEVRDGVATTIILDFDAEKSLHFAPGQGWMLTPVVQVLDVAILLAVTSPAPGAYVQPTLTVTGTVASQEPLSSLTVNGIAATVSGVDWSAPLTLAEGPATITATAEDALGRRAVASVQVHVDGTAPALAFTSPQNGEVVTGPTITVNGTIADASPVTVKVAGLDATVSGGTFTVAGVPITPGLNTLTATATDAAGNVGTASIAVAGDVSSAAEVIGPAGGAVVAPPGPMGCAAVIVPAGALSGEKTVGFTMAATAPALDAHFTGVGPAVELLPTGESFATDVRLQLPFSPALVRTLRAGARDVRVMTSQNGQPWVEAPAGALDMSAGCVYAATPHFSLVQVAVRYPQDLVVKRVAGIEAGGSPPGSEGTIAMSTQLSSPSHVVLDSTGRLFFVEKDAEQPLRSVIRKVERIGGEYRISTLVPPGLLGEDWVGGLVVPEGSTGPTLLVYTHDFLGVTSSLRGVDGSGNATFEHSLGDRLAAGLAWDAANERYLIAILPIPMPRLPSTPRSPCSSTSMEATAAMGHARWVSAGLAAMAERSPGR
jgi:hypothetical protein